MDQSKALSDLLEDISDWQALLKAADYRLVTPFLAKHISALSPTCVPRGFLELLKQLRLSHAQQALLQLSELDALKRIVFEPLGVPFVVLKGHALSHRYYRDPTLRISRDLDLLVRKPDLRRLCDRLIAVGYAPPHNGARQGSTSDRLDFLIRYEGRVSFFSPRGTYIELETTLKLQSGHISEREVFASHEEIKLHGTSLPVLREDHLLAYVCDHHTRHVWARLHWLADIASYQQNDPAGFKTALQNIEDPHLQRVSRTAVELVEILGTPDPEVTATSSALTGQMLNRTFEILTGEYVVETAVRAAFANSYLFRSRLGAFQARFRKVARAFIPRAIDFDEFPLPSSLQSLYWIFRPIQALLRRSRA